MRRRGLSRHICWLSLLLLGMTPAVAAQTTLTLGSVQAAQYRLEGLVVELNRSDGSTELEATASRLLLAGREERLDDLVLRCDSLEVGVRSLHCAHGTLSFRYRDVRGRVSVAFRHAPDGSEFTLSSRDFLGARMQAHLRVSAGVVSWDARLEVVDLAACALVSLLGWPANMPFLDGGAVLRAELQDGRGEVHLQAERLSWSDESGLRAAEDLSGQLEARLSRRATGWAFELSAAVDTGAIVHDELFFEAADSPLRVTAHGELEALASRLEVDGFELEQPGVVVLHGNASVGLEPVSLRALEVTMPTAEIAPLYERYLEAIAWDTPFASLEIEGLAGARLRVTNGALSAAELELRSVSLEDVQSRFAVYGVDARLRWDPEEQPRPSHLEWDGASVYRIDVGPARMEGLLHEHGFELSRPVAIPLLDGTLSLSTLTATAPGRTPLVWRTSAALTSVSIESLSHALGWPPFRGVLAGGIPELRYESGSISATGALVVRVFEGDVLIRDLVIDEAFGLVPALRANVDVFGLSLEPLTRAFSFGDIEGTLDGHVHDLLLEDWRPVSFDAQFQTPADDPRRHRISQNAVDSLAALGGGAGALSSTFLGFFDTFSYDRLGIRCRLSNGICTMGGVEPARPGYFIVKGGGFPPRIDVRGFNDRVSWKTLIERLAAVTRPDGVIIE